MHGMRSSSTLSTQYPRVHSTLFCRFWLKTGDKNEGLSTSSMGSLPVATEQKCRVPAKAASYE